MRIPYASIRGTYIWARADAIRVLEHLYAKKSKLPMQGPYGFFSPHKKPKRDPQGACTIIMKAEWGPYDPYGPYDGWLSKVQNGRKPCLKVVQLSVTRYTAPVWVKNILKVVRAHATFRMMTHGSSELLPLRSP